MPDAISRRLTRTAGIARDDLERVRAAQAVGAPGQHARVDAKRLEEPFPGHDVEVLLEAHRQDVREPVGAAVGVAPDGTRLQDQVAEAARLVEAGRMRCQLLDRDRAEPAGRGVGIGRDTKAGHVVLRETGQRDQPVVHGQAERRCADQGQGDGLDVIERRQVTPRMHQHATACDEPCAGYARPVGIGFGCLQFRQAHGHDSAGIGRWKPVPGPVVALALNGRRHKQEAGGGH